MSHAQTIVDSRRAVCEYVNSQDFNYAVIVLADSESSRLNNFMYFGGHPESWTPEDLNAAGVRMTECALDDIKSQSSTREFKLWPKKRFVLPNPEKSQGVLICVGFLPPWSLRRLFFWIEYQTKEFGVSFSIRSFEGRASPYWSARLILGPLVFRITRDIA